MKSNQNFITIKYFQKPHGPNEHDLELNFFKYFYLYYTIIEILNKFRDFLNILIFRLDIFDFSKLYYKLQSVPIKYY